MSENRSFGLQAWTNQIMLCVASLFGDLLRRTAPKFGTHVRIYTLTLNFVLTHPTRGGFRGLSIVNNLSRRTAPKFGTHVRIDTLTLKKLKIWPNPPEGSLGGYLLLQIFRDVPRPNLARMCGHTLILNKLKKNDPPHPRGVLAVKLSSSTRVSEGTNA